MPKDSQCRRCYGYLLYSSVRHAEGSKPYCAGISFLTNEHIESYSDNDRARIPETGFNYCCVGASLVDDRPGVTDKRFPLCTGIEIIAAPMSSADELQRRARAHEKHQMREKARLRGSPDAGTSQPTERVETLQEKMKKEAKTVASGEESDHFLSSMWQAWKSCSAIARRELAKEKMSAQRSEQARNSGDRMGAPSTPSAQEGGGKGGRGGDSSSGDEYLDKLLKDWRSFSAMHRRELARVDILIPGRGRDSTPEGSRYRQRDPTERDSSLGSIGGESAGRELRLDKIAQSVLSDRANADDVKEITKCARKLDESTAGLRKYGGKVSP
eukprot:scaffold2986_cov406-Prasinococcus_capsulatus_cf.AAC.2